MSKLTHGTSDIGKKVKIRKNMCTASHFFEKGSVMKIVNVSALGYSLMDENDARRHIGGVDFDDVVLLQPMSREELLSLIEGKINEVFLAYQETNDIESGDISPEDAFRLDEVQEELTELIINVCEKNQLSHER